MSAIKKKKRQLLFSFFKTNKLRSVSTILAGIIANIFTILIPVSLGKYFDLLFGFQSHRAAFLDQLPFSFWDDISEYLKFLIMLILLKTLFQFIQRFQTGVLGELFVKKLREQLFQQQLIIQSSVYDKKGTGKYLLRHSGDLKSIQNYLTNGIIRFSTDVILLFFAMLLLLWLDKMIFLIILGGIGLTILVVFILNKTLSRVSVKRRNIRSGLLSFVSTQLQSVKTIKVFNKAFTENKKYEKRSNSLLKIGIKFQRIYNFIFSIIPSLLYLTLVAVLYFIFQAKQQGHGSLNAGNTLGFIFLFITILPIFRRVIRVNTTWELGNISFNKLSKVFELTADNISSRLKPFEFKEGKIAFKNVSFSYNGNQPLFEKLNFIIQPYCINQISIGNGEGKSTLVKLFSGLYFPIDGAIEFDGQNIQALNLHSLRKKITFISDEFPLLGKTVHQLISYSRSKEKMSKAQAALDLFQKNIAEQFRVKLSDKAIDGGANFSNSQKKMLQYARVALSNKPIIIIDEPLRNLEKNTRKNILRWLKKQSKNRTIVILCKSWNYTSLEVDNIIELN